MSTESNRPGEPRSRARPDPLPHPPTTSDDIVDHLLSDDLATDDPVDEAELDRELATSSTTLRADLRTLLDPDRELGRRTAAEVDRTLRSRDTVGAALDLLTLSWWTGRAVLTDDRRPADAEREGR